MVVEASLQWLLDFVTLEIILIATAVLLTVGFKEVKRLNKFTCNFNNKNISLFQRPSNHQSRAAGLGPYRLPGKLEAWFLYGS